MEPDDFLSRGALTGFARCTWKLCTVGWATK